MNQKYEMTILGDINGVNNSLTMTVTKYLGLKGRRTSMLGSSADLLLAFAYAAKPVTICDPCGYWMAVISNVSVERSSGRSEAVFELDGCPWSDDAYKQAIDMAIGIQNSTASHISSTRDRIIQEAAKRIEDEVAAQLSQHVGKPMTDSLKETVEAQVSAAIKTAIAGGGPQRLDGLKPTSRQTRSALVSALFAIPGVSDAKVYEHSEEPLIKVGEIAVVVDVFEGFDNPGDEIAAVLNEHIPFGVTTVGMRYRTIGARTMNWFDSTDFDWWLHYRSGKTTGRPNGDPLSVKYDDIPLSVLIDRDEKLRTGGYDLVGVASVPPFSPAQRAALSAHWSAQLSAKVEASKSAEAAIANRSTLDADPDDYPW